MKCLAVFCALWLTAAPAFAANENAACTMPDAPLRPIMATHTYAPYPQMSVMTREEGTTLLDGALIQMFPTYTPVCVMNLVFR